MKANENQSAARKALLLRGWEALCQPLVAIIFGLVVGAVVILACGQNPMAVYAELFEKSFIKPYYLFSTLTRATPIIICAMATGMSWRAGYINLGVEGQMVTGTLVATVVALFLPGPPLLVAVIAWIAGMAAGAIVGLLKTFCNVNEVISGIMLNWIFLYATNMILTNVKEVASPYTYQMHSAAQQALLPSLGLDKLFSGNQYVTIAIPLAILMAILVWVVLEKTRFGYELKATGFNKHAAKYCGMAERRNTVLTLAIAGGLAALGGSLLYQTGYEQWQCTHSSVPNMGFNGICAAFLGGLNPIGAIFSSFFIQHITSGGAYVDKSLYCSQISDLITSIIIYMCGFVLFLKTAMNNSAARREERQRLAAESADTAPEAAPASESEQGAGTAPAQAPADSEKGGEAQ